MLGKREIMNKELIDIAIERLSYQLIEKHNKFESSILIGLQPRGAFLCKRLLKKLNFLLPTIDIKSGNLDISFYRDDLMRRDHPIEPDIMDINLSFEDKNIILVDDVLFTGRSIRSALDAILSFGRPKTVELLTLINRRFSRHLPIEPTYVGKTIDALSEEKVIVEWKEVHGVDRVLMKKNT
jgi:pyrimidine operon attenuation protein/uracil phosphoribosyltransferase